MAKQVFEFKVKLEGEDRAQAVEALAAMLDLKKSMIHEDLVLFAKKVKEKPSLIQTAKKWL
jgi:hypothetical protein